MAFSPTYREPFVQQDNVGVEYQVTPDLAISVSYLAAKGTHLQHWQDTNLSVAEIATIGIAQTRTKLPYPLYSRPIAGFDRILLLQTNGNSTYHGLAVQARKRFFHGFAFLAAYTFSKVIDDKPTVGALNPGPGDGGLLSDSLHPSADRGLGEFDQRHRLSVSGIWEFAYAKKMRRPARIVLGGWQVSGVLAVDSGQPYSGVLNFDLNNDGNAATDRLPGSGRNIFTLPTTAAFDLRLTRGVQFNDRFRLQVNWDAFNVFNRENVNGVNTAQYARSTSAAQCGIAGTPCLIPQTTGANAFGSATASLDPRIMQLSLRLQF